MIFLGLVDGHKTPLRRRFSPSLITGRLLALNLEIKKRLIVGEGIRDHSYDS